MGTSRKVEEVVEGGRWTGGKRSRERRHIGIAGHEGGDVEALAEQRIGDAVLALHDNAVVAQLALPRPERPRLCTAPSTPSHPPCALW